MVSERRSWRQFRNRTLSTSPNIKPSIAALIDFISNDLLRAF